MNYWIILLLQIVAASSLIYYYFNRKFSYWSNRGVKGPPSFNPLGNFWDYLTVGQVKLEKKWLKDYGKVYGYYKSFFPTLTIADHELIKQVLVKDFHVFVNRGQFPKLDEQYWTMNMFNAEDESWKRIRTISSPSFTSGKLKKMHLLMEHCLDKLTVYFDKVIQTKDGHMNAKEVIVGFTIDVIALTSFATETNANDDRSKKNPFIENGIRFFEISIWRVAAIFLLPLKVNKWLKNPIGFFHPKVFSFFVNLSKEIIKQRNGEKGKGIKRNDIVQLLMDAFVYENELDKTNYDQLTVSSENDVKDDREQKVSSGSIKRKLSETEIVAQSLLFFVAGFDTTANTISNALYNLAVYPETQERLYDELTQALDGTEDSEAYFDIVNNHIPYLDAFIKETLRMSPPVTRLQRQVGVDGYKLAGIPLEKGLEVEIASYAVHYCEDYYSNPEQFNPERFMPANKHLLVPYTYLPFGAGPRNCIGMRFAYQEIKLCLARIVPRYRLERTPQTKVPLDYGNLGFLTTKTVSLRICKR